MSTSAPEKIFHLKYPALPEIAFEWHPISKKVYSIALYRQPTTGELVCDNINSEVAARLAVTIWCQGYEEGLKAPRSAGRLL